MLAGGALCRSVLCGRHPAWQVRVFATPRAADARLCRFMISAASAFHSAHKSRGPACGTSMASMVAPNLLRVNFKHLYIMVQLS